MRGKPCGVREAAENRRITPAHAGKTRRQLRAVQGRADHPRACGENAGVSMSAASAAGSPPRMRGKQSSLSCIFILPRITPAHAGKTNAHVLDAERPAGSPPRMRGKLSISSLLKMAARITPAHAGKTRTRYRRPWVNPDHPRACGENSFEILVKLFAFGSPPRMRGKLSAKDFGDPEIRISPAHAGKTYFFMPHQLRPADHPRACGENSSGLSTAPEKCGSPPRMRGKRKLYGITAMEKRITPAHAGKTKS